MEFFLTYSSFKVSMFLNAFKEVILLTEREMTSTSGRSSRTDTSSSYSAHRLSFLRWSSLFDLCLSWRNSKVSGLLINVIFNEKKLNLWRELVRTELELI
jgi:hypothetical protein